MMIGTLVEAVRVAMGHTQDLQIGKLRILFVVGILFWAIIYDTVRTEEKYKKFFGGVEILISATLIWFQLGKIADLGWQEGKATDHFVILLGCVVLFTKGMKEWFVDVDKQYQ